MEEEGKIWRGREVGEGCERRRKNVEEKERGKKEGGGVAGGKGIRGKGEEVEEGKRG